MKVFSQYRGMSVQVKAALWYTICNFLQKGISFIVVPIYVRLLTTAEYGEWSVFQSWSGILIIFASLNLYCGVYTKTLVDMPNEIERDRYTSSMLGLGTLTTLIMLVIYGLIKPYAERWIGMDTPTILLMFGYFIVYPALSFWTTRQRVEYQYRRMVIVTLFISVLTPGVSILLLRFTALRAKAIIFGYLAVQSCFGFFFYILEIVKGKSIYNQKHWKYALKFNIPLIPHYLSLIVLGQSDRIMIKHYCGESDAGIYSFAYSIASAMSVLVSAINGARVPWTYEQLRDRVYVQLQKISNFLCILVGAITVGIALIAPEVVRIMATSEYMTACYVIPVVALGSYFTYVYDMFSGVEFYYGATKLVMIASCIGAVLNIVLNAIFIPIFGFVAAAYTTLVCYFVFMLMHYLFMIRVCKQQIIMGPIYDIKSIVSISVTISAISFLSLLTYNNSLIRFISLGVLFVICFVERSRIKDAFRRMKKGK